MINKIQVKIGSTLRKRKKIAGAFSGFRKSWFALTHANMEDVYDPKTNCDSFKFPCLPLN